MKEREDDEYFYVDPEQLEAQMFEEQNRGKSLDNRDHTHWQKSSNVKHHYY